MAQTGYTPIQLYYSTTATNVPLAANLVNGELALNIADMKLYAKDGAGVVTVLASAGGASGTVSSVNVSGGTTGVTFTGGPITSSGTITMGGTLAAANGGTGINTYAVGDTVYANTISTLDRLPIGAAARIMTSSGTAPQWTDPSTITVGNATTASNFAGGVANEIPYQTGPGVTAFVPAPTMPGRFLYWDTFGGFQWLAGTGLGTVTAVDVSGGTTGLTFSGGPITTAGTITMAGTLGFANGGTGLSSTPTNGQIDIGNGTGFTRTTITAGTGISVVNGSGTITINAVSTITDGKLYFFSAF